MLNRKNKLSLVLALLAVLSLAFISTGGEFLHSKIHHHQDQSSHDQCFIYQLQSQVLVALSTIILALCSNIAFHLIRICHVFVFQPQYNLPQLRAPPISQL